MKKKTEGNPSLLSAIAGVTVFIVIMLNQELNSMCLEKNHSQYHCDTLTRSGEHIRHRMCCWSAVLTIVGTLMVTGNYQSHGPVARCSQYWMKSLQTDTRGRGAGDKHSSNTKTGSFMGRDLITYVQSCSKLRKTSLGNLETEDALQGSKPWPRRKPVAKTKKSNTRKSELPMESATSCKVQNHQCREAYGK